MSLKAFLLQVLLFTTLLGGVQARVLERSMVDALARAVGFVHFADPTDNNMAQGAYLHVTRVANQGRIEVWSVGSQALVRTRLASFSFNLGTGEMMHLGSEPVLPAHTSYEMGPVLILYEFENVFQVIYYAEGQESVLLTDLAQRPLIRSINNEWFSVLIASLNRQSQTIFFNTQTLTQTRAFSNVLFANHDASVVLFSDELNVLQLAVAVDRQPQMVDDVLEPAPAPPVGRAGSPIIMDEEYTLFVLDTEDFAQNRPFIDVIKNTELREEHTLVLRFLSSPNATHLSRAFYSLRDGTRLYFN